ncbi:uncharacterized protein LOC101454591 [Ceratitis capitata]|uniref:(Mediterranean fruit fly) hypothetical protein n=1 Tax=Ceratitis capitata TaxID=7213 RepID=W8BW86_CERCA|nr:uncharacterized protein LOC101454591 [Ceratitis capitata]CAD7000395.1 unnamed protein product [Ceratitis capitata]
MKKVILTKSSNREFATTMKVTSPDNAKSKIDYSELFRVVLKIPEKDVQLRILDAVNGRTSTGNIVHAICPNCKHTFDNAVLSGKEAGTQTDFLEGANKSDTTVVVPMDVTQTVSISSSNGQDFNIMSPVLQKAKVSLSAKQNLSTIPQNLTVSKDTESSQTPNMIEPQSADATAVTSNLPMKRKRKRKVCLPQVVKRSHAQMALTHMQPRLKSRKVQKSPELYQKASDDGNDACRRDSISSLDSDLIKDVLWLSPDEHKSKEDHIMRTMAEECLEADRRTEGLLTIHRTIVQNDLYALRRQIFVWKKFKKVQDLNYLLTDEDENCLQLAIAQDCFPKIIDVLISEGLNANEIDCHSNTCVHLAILNEIENESLRLLMRKIDPQLLLHLNDDGYTPLHMAVRANSYLRAEIMLNTLDERLLGKPIFNRNIRASLSEKEFGKYYEEICKNLEKQCGNVTRNAQPKLKKKVLETGDRKSGNTALFFAVENKLEHFVFFLLAHLTDPRILNYCGQDAKSYYSEFGKMLQLSLRVDSAMENVVSLLR